MLWLKRKRSTQPKSERGLIMSNFAGVEICPVPGGDVAISLPVFAGSVMVIGSFDEAVRAVEEERDEAEAFALRAIAIRKMLLNGGVYD